MNLHAPRSDDSNAKVPLYDPLHFDTSKVPWHPFTPYSNDVLLKMIHINQVTGQVVMLLKAPNGGSLGTHHHYGTIHVYTLSGSWYYEEHKKDWIAKPGDFIYEVANSTHAFQALPGDDVLMFIVLEGALEFLDEHGQTIGVENAKTFQERYVNYCIENAIPIVDVNSMVRAN